MRILLLSVMLVLICFSGGACNAVYAVYASCCYLKISRYFFMREFGINLFTSRILLLILRNFVAFAKEHTRILLEIGHVLTACACVCVM